MQQLISKISNFISFDSIPVMGLADYVEILIIAFLVYEVMLWIKDTRAWSLMRGIVIILVFVLLAYLFQMTTILWLVRNGLNVLLMALLIIFQPELRRALDFLGRKNFFASIFFAPFVPDQQATPPDQPPSFSAISFCAPAA